MKILVIPDTHARPFWRVPVQENISKVDKVIFLGDEPDPYMDEGVKYKWEDVEQNLNDIISLKKEYPDKVELLLGNHSEHYRNLQFRKVATSVRFDAAHANYLYDIYNGDNYGLFKIAHTEKIGDVTFLFTHAGVSNFWANLVGLKIDDTIADQLNEMEDSDDGISKLAIIGRARTWFGAKTGSPLWCDIKEMVNDKGIGNGIFQIFGHSRLKEGAIIEMENYACVDSRTAFIVSSDRRNKKGFSIKKIL